MVFECVGVVVLIRAVALICFSLIEKLIEVVGVFDSRDDAEEWAEAYIDDAPNYKGYLQPPQWYVAMSSLVRPGCRTAVNGPM